MKVLSIRQPWLHYLATGQKEFEYRLWRTPYRGPILLHAPATLDKTAPALATVDSVDTLPRRQILYKAILKGIFQFDPYEHDDLGYYPEAFAWDLRDIHPLTQPIPCAGRLGLWEYAGDIQ
jgi:activating signal cointegrator 1